MFVVVSLLGVGALAYALLGRRDAVETVPSEPPNPEVARQSVEILELLRDLKRLSFDEALFRDPRFRSLVDFSVELAPEPKGRRNPFLPFVAVGGATGASTSTSTTTPRGAVPAMGGVPRR